MVDENKQSNVWTVTHQMVEDIMGYLKVKVLPKARRQKFKEGSGSGSSSTSSRKRKRSEVDGEPDKKRRA